MYKKRKEPLVISIEDGEKYRQKLSIAKPIALITYVLLIALIIYTESQSEKFNLAVWALKLLPLLMLIPGLIRQTFRTYSWLCFVCLIYFTAIFPVAYTRSLWTDWLITLLVTILFLSSMMTSRWLQYWRFYLQQQITSKNLSSSSN